MKERIREKISYALGRVWTHVFGIGIIYYLIIIIKHTALHICIKIIIDKSVNGDNP